MKRSKALTAAVLAGLMIFGTACAKESVGSHNTTNTSGIAQVLQSEIEKEDAKNEVKNDTSGVDDGTSETGSDTDASLQGSSETDDPLIMDDSELDDNSDLYTTQNANDQSNQYLGNVGSVAEEDYIDLTGMSADMVYAVVYDMMSRPNNYIGKTIKIEGLFSYYLDSSTGNEYYACIIEDARACCAQGMEFVPQDQYNYPADYPELFDAITVTGTFDVYYEGDQQDLMYMTLRNAVLG